MAAIDEFYKRLIEEFGAIEASPSVLTRVTPKDWVDKTKNGIRILTAPEIVVAPEEEGFEVRALKVVVVTLTKKKRKFIIDAVGVESSVSVPTKVDGVDSPG
jgi:hypothetical protein